MKRLCVGVIALLLALAQAASAAGETRLMVVSDIHYLAKPLYEGSEAFLRALRAGDGKLTQYGDELLTALLGEVERLRPDALLVTGDLSFNGEKASHVALAEWLARIEALKKAVANAVKEGEEHRKQVEELKRTRAADDAELRRAEVSLAKAEAAIQAATANLTKARSDLDTAKTATETIKTDIAQLKSQISGLEKNISACVAAVGDKALASLAAALRSDTPTKAPEIHETTADREKEEAKQIANDPLRIIREALDRMDADIRRTIDDNRTILV